MKTIRSCIKTLEKLSLLNCSEDVLPLLERALYNVEPILKVDTGSKEASIWQSELEMDRLHNDRVNAKLSLQDLKKNTSGFYEDYIAIGIMPKKSK